MNILIVKTAALGDVMRCTSVLPGLREQFPEAQLTWLTAPAARDLVFHHPLIDRVETCDPRSADSVAGIRPLLDATVWDWIISLDDEEPLCDLVSGLRCVPGGKGITGASRAADGNRVYSPDVAEWFDMGLLSVFGKEEADRRKILNQRTHPAIFADMLGVAPGHPELPLPTGALRFGGEFYAAHDPEHRGLRIGLNTGSGGRWHSKQLPVDRVAEVAARLATELDVSFVLLGGPEEEDRNAALMKALKEVVEPSRLHDAGTRNALLDFAAIIDGLDLLLTSDSLALHLAIARRVPVVAFFAPTSAAEIELYGRGEKVVSNSPDYCSYKRDADTSTLTADRVADACLRQARVILADQDDLKPETQPVFQS